MCPLSSSLRKNKKFLTNNAEVLVAGFGVTDGKTKEGAGTLRVANTKIIDTQYSSSEVVVDQSTGSGVCHGDSGGPVFLQIKGKLYLWGITSRRLNNANEDCSGTSIHTNTLYYKTWLNRMANDLTRSLVQPQVTP